MRAWGLMKVTHCVVDDVPGVGHELVILSLKGAVARPGGPKGVHLCATTQVLSTF